MTCIILGLLVFLKKYHVAIFFTRLHILVIERMVIAMSLIPCTSGCVYQIDGCCTLERVASCGTCAEAGTSPGCVHFIGRASDSGRQKSVSDGLDHGQL